MPQLAYPHPNLPGFAPPKTYAAWPVWSGSTTAEIRFAPVPKERAWYIYRKLREWNRSDAKGRYTGLVGSAALRVAESLLFDFLNFASGRLDPSYEGIAQKTHLGRSTVAVALKRLKQLGVIQWVKRCSTHRAEDGRLERRQETNAYGVLPPSQWRGFVDPNPAAPTA